MASNASFGFGPYISGYAPLLVKHNFKYRLWHDLQCPNCGSKFYLTTKSNIASAREETKLHQERCEKEQIEWQNQIEEKKAELSSIGKLTEEMYVEVQGVDYSNLPWLSKEEFEKIVEPVRSTLPLPFSLTDEEIISNAVAWCTEDSISKKYAWNFFYPEDEERGESMEIIVTYSRNYDEDVHWGGRSYARPNNRRFRFQDSEHRVYDSYPPDVLVDYPPLPMSIEYEKRSKMLYLCDEIRNRLYYVLRDKIEEFKENRIANEKRKLVNISNDLALFARDNYSKKITNKLVNEFLEEKNIQFIWRDSRDIVRIRSGLILKGLR